MLVSAPILVFVSERRVTEPCKLVLAIGTEHNLTVTVPGGSMMQQETCTFDSCTPKVTRLVGRMSRVHGLSAGVTAYSIQMFVHLLHQIGSRHLHFPS